MSTQVTKHYHLPTADDLEKLLASLLGIELFIKESTLQSDASDQVVVTYCDDDQADAVVAYCDFTFANGVGAALARIPPALANESSKEGTCPENLRSNFEEVMNIGAGSMTNRSAARLAFKSVSIPPHESGNSSQVTEGIAFSVDLGNYGVGNISIHLLNEE